jgi:hypothetical protein
MSRNAEPWAYGASLTDAIRRSGMTKHEIGRRAGFSSTRIKQLEDGFASGSDMPARPRTINVVRLASVLSMDLRRALEMAGKGDEIPEGMTDGELWAHFNHLLIDPLEKVSTEDLLQEVRKRIDKKNGDADDA